MFCVRFIVVINDQGKEDEMGRACSTNREKRNTYRILGKRPLGRPWILEK
jgi:hypothetical protein